MIYDLDWYLSRAREIEATYQEVFGRPSDFVGACGWLMHMREEGHDIAWVKARFLESDEWHAIHDVPAGLFRPLPHPHLPLPPFDANDSFGDVHTTPPPELVIPLRDPMFMLADFNGTCVDLERFGLTIVKDDKDQNWRVGANSTPLNMLMTPMLPLYPRKVQDAVLTEHAERNHSHLVVASEGWNFPQNGFAWEPSDFVDWCKYVQSWGFYVVHWGPPNDNLFLRAAVDAQAITWYIAGEEVDSKLTKEQYDANLDTLLAGPCNGIPVGAHFTANYPEGFPRDTFLIDWNKYDGRVHLMWQANQDDSAGKQAAMLYYARMRVALGQVGGNGQTALNSRVYAYETMASKQLYGKCSEEYGCLRSLQLLYTTRRDPRIPPVAGVGNGSRLPDGRPL